MERGTFVPLSDRIIGRKVDRARPAHDAAVVAARCDGRRSFRRTQERALRT
jgi:hypothetical protein